VQSTSFSDDVSNFDRYFYAAAGRLSLWDTFARNRRGVVQRLTPLLRAHAGASLEATGGPLYKSNAEPVVALGTILDKLVARGVPTLVDLSFERRLTENCDGLHVTSQFENTNGREVGPGFERCEVEGSALLETARHLLHRPHDMDMARRQIRQRSDLAAGADASVSSEEDAFFDAFGDVFSVAAQVHLRRQVPIPHLIGRQDSDLADRRVDFALDLGGDDAAGWVFEVDGTQHDEAGQAAYDDRRDEALRDAGWRVARPSAQTVRDEAARWLREEWRPRLDDAARKCLNDATERSEASEKPEENETYENAAERLARRLIVRPHVAHRALRGWVQMLLLDVLPTAPSGGALRLLVLEEDVPGAVEALDQLLRLWEPLSTISREAPPPPDVTLHAMGAAPPAEQLAATARSPHLHAERVDAPQGDYDLIVSHAHTLLTGEEGALEATLPEGMRGRRVRLRASRSRVDDRRLQWSPPLTYALDDLEDTLRTQGTDDPQPLPEAKLDALRFFLQTLFRLHDFWDGQARVIARLLRGESAVVLLPTGGGKSLCYQFSGLLLPGVTLIVDPLVALMNDQVENLRSLALDRVGAISGMKSSEQKQAEKRALAAGERYFEFITPERLQMPRFRKGLRALVADTPVSLAVIDEVHCVSEWGHDFRPSYLHLGRNIERYCTPPGEDPPTLVGLTGTASFSILTDVQVGMNLREEEAVILPESFDREELVFHVEQVQARRRRAGLKSLHRRLPRLFEKNPQTFFQTKGRDTNGGLIFCPHVNGSLGVVQIASAMGHGHFFCGSTPKSFDGTEDEWNKEKLQTQRDFKHDKIQELVATKSFGMGIDKPNIRYTIHYGIPQSVEGFYQEAGRAGRNGKPRSAHCFILYSDDNWEVAQQVMAEADHRRAAEMLDRVNWNDRGDVLHQLWFLFKTYEDREEEKQFPFTLWKNRLAGAVEGLPPGAKNTVEVPFDFEQEERGENAIFRLVMLGVVDEYAVLYDKKAFEVRVKNVSAADVKAALRAHFEKYKFEAYARQMVADLPEAPPDGRPGPVLHAAIGKMIDFVYDEIVAKRKQALRTMAELCRSFESDEQFRKDILAYLQESEFSEELREWVGRPFVQVGMEEVNDILAQLESLEQARRLVGTTRRMLDEDPGNVALRLLSVKARLRSETESDESVCQEFEAFLGRSRISDWPDGDDESPSRRTLLARLLEDVQTHRSALFNDLLDRTLRRYGSVSLVRALREALPASTRLTDANRAALTALVAGDALETVRGLDFLDSVSSFAPPSDAS
jgi:ATP-dependent DNA helicase RecQ